MAENTLDQTYENWYSKNNIYQELIKDVQIISFPKIVNLVKRAFTAGYNLGYCEGRSDGLENATYYYNTKDE